MDASHVALARCEYGVDEYAHVKYTTQLEQLQAAKIDTESTIMDPAILAGQLSNILIV